MTVPDHTHGPGDAGDPECSCYLVGFRDGMVAGEASDRAEHEDDEEIEPREPLIN